MPQQFSRTWWGQRFIAALENITDDGRLSRGRSYARGGKVKSFQIDGGHVVARVRGSVNPYFGVYKEPLYSTEITLKPISTSQWSTAIGYIASKASFISKLLLNEVPDNIDDAFADLGLSLLPHSRSDLQTSCSCPDYSNPCKHIAGVYYLVAAELDRDPFVLFELRGLSRDKLREELAKSPLGAALLSELETQQTDPVPVPSYHTRPQPIAAATIASPDLSLREFWQGTKRLPKEIEASPASGVPAILVKKQGDFPAFWTKDQSFIATMEEFYDRVKTKNRL